MTTPNQTSAALRYFRARLRVLKKPLFWGSATFIVLIVLAAWEYGVRPSQLLSQLTNQQDANDPTGISSEDQALGADIDSSPVLLRDFGLSAPAPLLNPTTPQTPNQPQASDAANTTGAGTSALFTTDAGSNTLALLQQSAAVNSSSVAQADSLGIPDASLSLDTGINGLGSTSQMTPVPTNVLQQALDRAAVGSSTLPNTAQSTVPPSAVPAANSADSYNPASSSSSAGVSAPPDYSSSANSSPYSASPYSSAPYTATPGGTVNPYVNSYTGLVGYPGSGAAVAIPPSPPPIPSQPNNFNPSLYPDPSQFGLGNASGVTQTGASPYNPAIPQVQPTNTVPFSAPRSIPGRYIGGGQINTFSNP